jgi:tetratricopeptide (TPR) repeat protein
MGRIDQDARELELNELVRAHQLDRAALLARAMGQPRYAARLFADAQLPYQSAVCFYEAGEPLQALAKFLAVPKEDARYRSSCVHLLRIASEQSLLSQELDAYLADFAASEPKDPHELRALYRLGTLYQANELFDHAREILGRVARIDPTNADARQRVSVLEGLVRGSPAIYETILRPDAAEWRPAPRASPASSREQAGEPVSVEVSWSVATPGPTVEPTLVSKQGTTVPPPPATSELAPGTLVANRYRVEKEVGRGGMGVVYHAVDLELGLAVALKVFSQRLDEEGLLHRFKQELTLCRQLTHPNIVRLYDIGAHGGRKFISMELLEGASLRGVLKDRRPSLPESVDLLRQACSGLGAAHAVGIVHRDIKPDNLFLTERGLIKLTDFGLAKKQGESDGHTIVGFMGGSPNYMAPEQITDFGAVTVAADLYSLGIVAYEVTTGSKPFQHKERQKVLEMHLTKQPALASTVNPAIPGALDRLILDLLRKDPAERLSDCAVVIARLDEIAAMLERLGAPKPSA